MMRTILLLAAFILTTSELAAGPWPGFVQSDWFDEQVRYLATPAGWPAPVKIQYCPAGACP